MATKPKKRRKSVRKRKVNINLTQRVHIVEKNDATRIAKRENPILIYSHTPMPRTNGAVFKIKIKHK